MKYLFLSLCAFFIPFMVYSQTEYKKAIVIDNKGDSIYGFVKDLGWDKNPDKFIFSSSIDGQDKQTIELKDILKVIIPDEVVYQKFTTTISMDEVKFSMIHTGPDTSKVTKAIFLKVLIEGCNVNLYSFTDGLKTRFFFTDQNIYIPRELIFRNYHANEGLNIVRDETFKKQLNYLAKLYKPNSKELNNKIKTSNYYLNDFIRIFSLINGDNNAIFCPVYINPVNTRFQLFGHIGIRNSTLAHMDYTDCHKLTAGCKKNISVLPAIGIGLNISKSENARISFRVELDFSMDKVSSSDKYIEPLNYYSEDFIYRITQKNLGLCNTLNYNYFHYKKIKGYFGMGITINYSNISKSEYFSHVYGPYTNYNITTEPLLDRSRIGISFPLQLGFVIGKRVDLNTIYYFPLSQNNDVLIRVWEFGVSINFTR